MLRQLFFRFCIGGFLTTMVHTAIAYFLIVRLRWDASVGNGIAFVGATSFSYRVNTRWSFRSVHSMRRLSRFLVVVAAGAGMSALVAGYAAAGGYLWWQGIFAVIVVVTPLTYFAHQNWTFR